MPYRKLVLTSTVVLSIVLTGIYLFNWENLQNELHFAGLTGGNRLQRHRRHDLDTLHIHRIQHMRKKCKENGNKNARDAKTAFLYSPKYSFHFCSVPKVGSTFWQKIVRILEHGVDYLDEVLYKKRRSIHKQDHTYKEHIAARNPYATVAMISRDPYSRLYSAYVDKQFIKRQFASCKEPTFEKYLNTILNTKNIANVNHHVRPVSAICDPCALKPKYLLKQETFAEDVLYVMRELGINEGEIRVIFDLLYNLRAANNVPGIVKTMYAIGPDFKAPNCFSWKSVAQRLWISFQIQGYIDERVDFPYELFKDKNAYRNGSFLIETILETIHDIPMTQSEIQEQRTAALNRAYSNLSDELIRLIREKYYLDFLLFNYTTKPPGIDKKS